VRTVAQCSKSWFFSESDAIIIVVTSLAMALLNQSSAAPCIKADKMKLKNALLIMSLVNLYGGN